MLDLKPVVDLALDGRRTSQIASQLGLSVFTVRRRIGLARARGFLPADFVIASATPRRVRDTGKLKSVKALRTSGRVVIGGGIVQLLESLPLPISNWLIEAVPQGATVSDMLRGFIVDAYNEEHP